MELLKDKTLELLGAINDQDITDEVELNRLLDQALLLVGTESEPMHQPSPQKAGRTPVAQKVPVRLETYIYCDGSCEGNPGPGGWGTLIDVNGLRQEFSGGSPQSTNNIMEMTAAIEGLKRTEEKAKVVVTTDSQYLIKGITQWIKGWKKRGWKKADGQPVLNQELWKELDRLAGTRTITWTWVKGHAGHPENERCDELAKAAVPRKNARPW